MTVTVTLIVVRMMMIMGWKRWWWWDRGARVGEGVGGFDLILAVFSKPV